MMLSTFCWNAEIGKFCISKLPHESYLQVTETASFQKDLSLDSLDRTELVMAFEQEFSIEIPDEV